MMFSEEQIRRLRELSVDAASITQDFASHSERNKSFQLLENELVAKQKQSLIALCEGVRRPRILDLEERLGSLLRKAGFIQVNTPIILAKNRLEKMGITQGSPLGEQVFWLDSKRCLRPMLAPHLYEYMLDLGKLLPRPLRLFEIGSCFRKETHGAKHANEFTMLNLVEMGNGPDVDLQARLEELGAMVIEEAGIKSWHIHTENSAVYGDANDFSDANGMELASSAIGPLPMDADWSITENWVGIGFGLERLVMSASNFDNLAKAERSITYLDGIRLHL